MSEFMVEIKLPEVLSEEFLALIPEQVDQVNKLIADKKITSYTLNNNRSRLWTTVEADSEEEVVEIISTFPLIQWMKFEIHDLMLNYQNSSVIIPRMSLN